MIVTQWFTQCGDQEVCTEPAPPPEVPGMSWREVGKSVSSESGVCSAAVSAMLRSLPSLGLACGCKSVQQGLRTVSHQSPSPMPCLPGGLPQASIPPPPPLAVHTRAQGAEGPRPPRLPQSSWAERFPREPAYLLPSAKLVPLQMPVPTSPLEKEMRSTPVLLPGNPTDRGAGPASTLNSVLSTVPSLTRVSFTFYL